MEDIKYDSIKRFEIINHSKETNGLGREYTRYGNFEIEIQVQDDGKTLKIFISDGEH